jgi:hypothetical protein
MTVENYVSIEKTTTITSRLGTAETDEALAEAIEAFLDGKASGARRVEDLMRGIPFDRARPELRAWVSRFMADHETRAQELLLRCMAYRRPS